MKRLKREVIVPEQRVKLQELLEFVMISRLSNLSKEEIRIMLDLVDFRQTRFYREVKQEGVDEGKVEERVEIIRRMASKGFEIKQIAEIVDLDVKAVRKILKSKKS